MDKVYQSYKLAVIIPNYNGQNYIKRMLDAILIQDFQDWKVFIVDDNSTDNSCNIITKYTKNDKRFILINRQKEPKGAPTCRNIGFEHSLGAEYVLFFDNDDSIAPYCFSQRIRFMDKHPELDFGIFPAKAFRESYFDEVNAVFGCKFIDDSLNAMLNMTLPMVGWTNIYRRTRYVEKKLSWDTNLLSLQDSDFNIQAIIKGCIFEYAESLDNIKPDYFYYIPQKRSSITTKIETVEHFNSHIYLINKIIDSLSDFQKEKYKVDILCFILHFVVIMGKHNPSVQLILANKWIKNQSVFWIKLFIWNLLGRKFKLLYYLYNPYFLYFKDRQREWNSFMKRKASLFRQDQIAF